MQNSDSPASNTAPENNVDQPSLNTFAVTDDFSVACFSRPRIADGPWFAVREWDIKVIRKSSGKDKEKGGERPLPFSAGLKSLNRSSEQAIRASIRQVILHMGLHSEPATRDEVRLLKLHGIIGKRAPSCSLLSGEDMIKLLEAFGKEQSAQDLKAALQSKSNRITPLTLNGSYPSPPLMVAPRKKISKPKVPSENRKRKISSASAPGSGVFAKPKAKKLSREYEEDDDVESAPDSHHAGLEALLFAMEAHQESPVKPKKKKVTNPEGSLEPKLKKRRAESLPASLEDSQVKSPSASEGKADPIPTPPLPLSSLVQSGQLSPNLWNPGALGMFGSRMSALMPSHHQLARQLSGSGLSMATQAQLASAGSKGPLVAPIPRYSPFAAPSPHSPAGSPIGSPAASPQPTSPLTGSNALSSLMSPQQWAFPSAGPYGGASPSSLMAFHQFYPFYQNMMSQDTMNGDMKSIAVSRAEVVEKTVA